MKKTLRIHEMNDREYRRYQLLRRRRLELKNRFLIASVIFCVMLSVSFLFRTTHSSANQTDEIKYKYFTVISVGADDTLWKIADQYIDYSIYKNKTAYLDEVAKINGLKDSSSVQNGQKITVPYYSSEYIR